MSKVIIVTGASRGIGLAITKFLLAPEQSCNVVVLSRSQNHLQKIRDEAPDRVAVVAGDASDLSLGQRAVHVALSRFGRLDGLVVNHGQVEPVERFAEADIDAWKEAFDVNVFSAISIIKAAIPPLRKSKGRIVITSSGAAVKGTATWGCYGASKAVLNHLPLTLQKEEPDIVTIAIRPGVVATQMQDTLAERHYQNMDAEDAKHFKSMREEGKMLRPEQAGNVMARLVLGAPSGLNGMFLNWNDEQLKSFQD